MDNKDIFDLTKLILVLMVIAIHSNFLPLLLYPWLRLAVPMFFVISSFLFFSKNKNLSDLEKKKHLKHYVIRLLKLYIFWFIVLLPVTIYLRRGWFNNGIYLGILKIITNLFLGSTFIASWYIAAIIIGMLFINYFSDKLNDKMLLIIVILLYMVCCLSSSYSFIFKSLVLKNDFYEIHYTFVVSLIYIYLGKLFSENKIQIDKKSNILLLVISCILLYTECFIVCWFTGNFNNDCYLFLPVTVLLIFNLIRNIDIKVKWNILFRQFSSFSYPLHGSILYILSKVLNGFINSVVLRGIMFFGLTIIICSVLFYIVKRIENKFKILKCSY